MAHTESAGRSCVPPWSQGATRLEEAGIRPAGEASTAKTRPLANTKRGGPPQVAFCATQLKLYETSETGKEKYQRHMPGTDVF